MLWWPVVALLAGASCIGSLVKTGDGGTERCLNDGEVIYVIMP